MEASARAGWCSGLALALEPFSGLSRLHRIAVEGLECAARGTGTPRSRGVAENGHEKQHGVAQRPEGARASRRNAPPKSLRTLAFGGAGGCHLS